MPAGGGNAIGGGPDDADILKPVAVDGSGDDLSGQGHGGKDGAWRDAVAVMAKPLDGEFAHPLPIACPRAAGKAYSAASRAPRNPPDCRDQ